MDASINNRIQEIEERISDAEDIIESINTRKCKIQKAPDPKHPGKQVQNGKTNP